MKISNFSENFTIKKISEKGAVGVFEMDGLYTGYGLTVGNALRRVLLSSLPGAAITHAKIRGVGHEFTTIPNVLEDVVEIILNLKKLRFRIFSDEPQIVTVKVKGEKEVTAGDIAVNANVEVINPDAHIATLTSKSAELEMELTIEQGLGYVPVETRQMEKLPIGMIALDAIFSPVVKANFVVENMRVGERTDYNKVTLTIETDGSMSPSEALKRSTDMLQEHFAKIGLIEVAAMEKPAAGEKEAKKKKVTKKK